MKLTTKAPVYVGNGQKIDKREYVIDPSTSTLYRLHPYLLFKLLEEKKILFSFEQFINQRKKNLYQFFKENRLESKLTEISTYKVKYDKRAFNSSKGNVYIYECLKDAYHMPYIPGSSLKGALIQCVLTATALRYQKDLNNKFYQRLININLYDKYEKNQLRIIENEIMAFLTERVINSKENNMKIGSIISVSDSDPIDLSRLAIAQKIDYLAHSNERNQLNVFRESIIKETDISSTLTFPRPDLFDMKDLQQAIDQTMTHYNNIYREVMEFDPNPGCVFLGAGTGFITKTLVYAVFEEEESLAVAAKILEYLFKKIKRDDDLSCCLVPKTIKYGKVNNELDEMGLCSIQFEARQ